MHEPDCSGSVSVRISMVSGKEGMFSVLGSAKKKEEKDMYWEQESKGNIIKAVLNHLSHFSVITQAIRAVAKSNIGTRWCLFSHAVLYVHGFVSRCAELFGLQSFMLESLLPRVSAVWYDAQMEWSTLSSSQQRRFHSLSLYSKVEWETFILFT